MADDFARCVMTILFYYYSCYQYFTTILQIIMWYIFALMPICIYMYVYISHTVVPIQRGNYQINVIIIASVIKKWCRQVVTLLAV